MSPYLDLAIDTLEDLRDDLHRQANKRFFSSQFVSYGDFSRDEATVRNCLALLRTLRSSHPLPAENQQRLAS